MSSERELAVEAKRPTRPNQAGLGTLVFGDIAKVIRQIPKILRPSDDGQQLVSMPPAPMILREIHKLNHRQKKSE